MLFLIELMFVGDYLEYKNQIGKVQKTSLLTSTIVTKDGRLISIPNGEISNDKILRSSLNHNHKPDLTFVLKDFDQADNARQIVKNILRTSIDMGLDCTATNTIFITKDKNFKLILCALSHCESNDSWESLWDLKSEMYNALIIAGCIDIE